MITCQVLTMPNTTCTRKDAPLGVLSQEFGLLVAAFLVSLTSASSLVHLTSLFASFLLPVCIPMGVIPWPRKTAGKTQSRLEQSLNLGALLVMDLLTVVPQGATEQDLALGIPSCFRQTKHWLTRPLEQVEMARH